MRPQSQSEASGSYTRCLGTDRADKIRKISEPLEELAELEHADDSTQRQRALLTAILWIFREASICPPEKEVAQYCLKAAEELTGSACCFIGELNALGRFETTTLSEAGWYAFLVRMPEAAQMFQNMPKRG